MSKAKKFEDLVVWQKAHRLVARIYKLSKEFPRDERFGLTSQLRRAAVSIPANIVEGLKLPAASCRESSKCKEMIPFYCSSLANPAASYGECARWSIFKRATIPEKLRYFNIAQGSLAEVRYYIILAHDLEYVDALDLNEDLAEIGRMLEGYMKSMREKK